MTGRENRDSAVRRRAGAIALLLLAIAGTADASAIYRCTNAGRPPAYQGEPCLAGTTQTAMHVRGQPLIDAGAPIPPVLQPGHGHHHATHASHGRARRQSRHNRGQATSWECRAADGEVFYRHTRCPHSVPGDGVMRSGGTYALHRGSGSRSRARSAWDPVPVHARKVPRELACREINAVAAVERDGSARDEHVSAYEHNLGRDPCSGY